VSLIELRERPTPVDVWIDRGRLLRLDLPRLSMIVVRNDVIGLPGLPESRGSPGPAR
jgi:hypothetical protein